MNYQTFLQEKQHQTPVIGFNNYALSSHLFDYQKLIVKQALKHGRYAVFAECGLGKTLIKLECAKQIHQHTNKPVLILAPLSVAQQTANIEAPKFGFNCNLATDKTEIVNDINITNYEKLEKFDPSVFSGVLLDESSILKGYNSKTKRLIIDSFYSTPYRLAFTATPSPNDFMELGNHAEFLGVMSYTEMLATFFIHDGGNTSQWRLKKHGKLPFWQWLCQWSVMLRKPSDLGFSDDNFQLPKLNQYEIKIESGYRKEGELITIAVHGISEQRKAKRETLDKRCQAVADLVKNSTEQWLIFCDLNDESKKLKELIPDAVEVKGSDKENHKTESAITFAKGEIQILISKPKIFGFGMNFQSCHNVVFVGLNNSFEAVYQAVRRCYRYGQKQDVDVYYVCADIEGSILKNMKRKQRQFDTMYQQLTNLVQINEETLMINQKDEYTTDITNGNNYTLYKGDCVEIVSQLEDNSIDFSIFSPPFSSLYTYSNSDRDMGNSSNDEQFYQHFKFLVKDLYRVLKPGCLTSFHCQNIPAQIGKDGYYGRKDFRGELIRLFEEMGFIYYSEVTIWKDPVVQMQRTKALGLLHKQVQKDSSRCHQGYPDYLVSVKKPGDRNEPVAGIFQEYYGLDTIPNTDKKRRSIEIWQRYASPVWWDINPSDTLQFRTARDNDDERHICPLQLQVIERSLQLYTNPGDMVLDPFNGIGSSGYVALEKGRKYIGIELKDSYYELSKKNLDFIENKPQQLSLLEA